MQAEFPFVRCVDAATVEQPFLHGPPAPLGGYALKVFALYATSFDRVLLLDSDCLPVIDPDTAFRSPEFRCSSLSLHGVWCVDLSAASMPKDSLALATLTGASWSLRSSFWIALTVYLLKVPQLDGHHLTTFQSPGSMRPSREVMHCWPLQTCWGVMQGTRQHAVARSVWLWDRGGSGGAGPAVPAVWGAATVGGAGAELHVGRVWAGLL